MEGTGEPAEVPAEDDNAAAVDSPAVDTRTPFRSAAADRAGSKGTSVNFGMMRADERTPGLPLDGNQVRKPGAGAHKKLPKVAVLNMRMAEIEEQLRLAVKAAKEADPGLRFVDARLVLQQLLEEGDQGGGAVARKARQKLGDKVRPRRSRMIDLKQFRAVINNEDVKPEERRPRNPYRLPLRGLHMALPEDDTQGLFQRYATWKSDEKELPHDALMPYDALVQRLYAGDAHNAAQQGARIGPYTRNEPKPHDPERPGCASTSNLPMLVTYGLILTDYLWLQGGWSGVILKAPQFAKSSVMPPSNWDEQGSQICRRSSSVPSSVLKLEHVFGYSGLSNSSPNLFYTRGAEDGKFNLAYYTAAVGVVYEETKVQDDAATSVLALTKLPDADLEDLLVSLDLDPAADASLRSRMYDVGSAMPEMPAADLFEGPLAEKIPLVEDLLNEVHAEAKLRGDVQPRQRFFVRHDDDITCTAVHPELEMVATGQSMASRQRGSGTGGSGSQKGATVFIWSARTTGVKGQSAEPIRLQMPVGDTILCAMAFSADGWLLTTISAEHDTATHHVRVWDWARGTLHCSAVAGRGEAPHVFGCVWNRFESWEPDPDGTVPEGISSFVTYGRKSIMMWEYMMGEDGRPPSIHAPKRSPKVGRWGGPPTDVLTACYVRRDVVLAGTASGTIAAWVGSSPAVKTWSPYRPGKKSMSEEDEGQWGLREGGCTLLRMHPRQTDRMLSAGGEKYGNGVVIIDWRIVELGNPKGHSGGAGNKVSKSEKVHCPITLEKQRAVRIASDGPMAGPTPMVIGLDWHPLAFDADGNSTGKDVFVLGDTGNDIYEGRFPEFDSPELNPVLLGDAAVEEARTDASDPVQALADLIVGATMDPETDIYDPHVDPVGLEYDLKLLSMKDLHARAESVVAEMVPKLDSRQLMEGASSSVFGAAVHPSKQHVYATACEDGFLYLWDAKKHACIRQIRVARLGHLPGKRPVDWPLGKDWPTGKGDLLRVRACAFSPDGKKLALSTGSDSGRSGVYSSATGRRAWSHYDKGGVVRIYLLNAQPGAEGAGLARDDVLISPDSGGLPDEEMEDLVLCEHKVSSEGMDTLSFSPDSRYLACGSHDNFVYIVDTEEKLVRPARSAPKGTPPTTVVMDRAGNWDPRNDRLKVSRSAAVHSSYVTHMDWSVPDGGVDEYGENVSILQTSSGAHELLYLDVTSARELRVKLQGDQMGALKKRAEAAGIDERRLRKPVADGDKVAVIDMIAAARSGRLVSASQRNTHWSSWTATLGFDVMGMWRSGMDGTDINSCCRSPDCTCFPSRRCVCKSPLGAKPGGALLASADDSGAIHLLNYPAVVGDAPSIPFRGHASHVCAVRFMADGRRLVSTGGTDRCSFQWRVIRPKKDPDYMRAAPEVIVEEVADEMEDRGAASPAGRIMDTRDVAALRVQLLEAEQEADAQREIAEAARSESSAMHEHLVVAEAERDRAKEEAVAIQKMHTGGADDPDGRGEDVAKIKAELDIARDTILRGRSSSEAKKVELAKALSDKDKLVLDLAGRSAAVEAGDAMAAKLRSALRKGRMERAGAEKEITRLKGQISRLSAEVAQHVNAQAERQELRLAAAESQRRESVAEYKLQMREGEMDKLRGEIEALRELVMAEKAGGEKQLTATRVANGQVSAAEAAVALIEGEWSVGSERMASMSVVALGQLRTQLEASSSTVAEAIDRVAEAEAGARQRVLDLLDRVEVAGGEVPIVE